MRHGSNIDPPNRFESVHREPALEHLEWDQEPLRALTNRKIEYIDDASQSIISENSSPDIPFRYSLNPYRGCAHACSYCYARPGHDYLGFNAGLDFETKIVVKRDAPQLFRDFLSKKNWKPEPITFSGVTANYILLRLPLTVEPVFIEWLQRVRPHQAEKVLGRLHQARGGKLNSSAWGERMVGRGEIAEQIKEMFRLFRQRHRLNGQLPPHDCSRFERPSPDSGQLRLF